MRHSLLLFALLASTIGMTPYRKAVALFDDAMYGRARTMFEAMPQGPLSEGYVVLCALKMRSGDYPQLMECYLRKYPSSTLTSSIRFENAMRLFDSEKYDDAKSEFSLVPFADVPSEKRAEFEFKQGYCSFATGLFPEAVSRFEHLDSCYVSDYNPTARYLCGVMNYDVQNFDAAISWFSKSVKDPRFKDLSLFYLVDCQFNRKNYDYVITEGSRIYESVIPERRERLSRMISESYLVKGEKQKALEYYENASRSNMTRSDYFYAASVLYAVEDYVGAIENFSRMTYRTDSLGQVANYHMANSYIRIKNKVAALDAFRDAALVDYDSKITEDAYFNYAKLSFDLNKDTSVFAEYIKRYSTRTRGEQIYSYMALTALVDRDYALAVEAYDKIDELDDGMRLNYAKANYLRAAQLVANGSYRDAVPFLKASAYYIPKYDKFNQLSRYWLAESLYKTGSWEEAGKTYTDLFNGSALQNMAEGALLPYNVAYCHLNMKEWESAAKWFENYIGGGRKPYLEDAVLRRADCDFAARNYKGAVDSYQRAIEMTDLSKSVYPLYRQALSYGLDSDRKRKLSVLKTVGEKSSPAAAYYYDALYELGRTYMEMKNNKDALSTFRSMYQSSDEVPVKARALIGLGMVNRNAGNYTKALEYYKETVSLAPGTEFSENAMVAIESIYQKLHQPEKYIEYLEQNSLGAMKSDKERERMFFTAAEQLYLSGDYVQALPSLRNYLEKYPQSEGSADAVFYMAECYKACEEKEKACECYAMAMGLKLSSPSFVELSKLNYASLSYGLERFKDAYDGYVSLLSTANLESNRSVARLGMMRSSYRAKDFQAAMKAAADVKGTGSLSGELRRETDYVMAKSLLASSQRDKALEIFKQLSKEPSTPEGAEARYILVQDAFDKGQFDSVEGMVYDFSANAGDQSYWLARTYIVLGDTFLEKGKDAQARATFESIRDGYEAYDGSSDDIADNIRIRLERMEKLNK